MEEREGLYRSRIVTDNLKTQGRKVEESGVMSDTMEVRYHERKKRWKWRGCK